MAIMDLIDRTKYRKDLLHAYDDVSMEFDVLDSQPSVNVIPVPEGATNGDMIKSMFPDCEVTIRKYMGFKCGLDVTIHYRENECFTMWFPFSWWNAPYKKEVKE